MSKELDAALKTFFHSSRLLKMNKSGRYLIVESDSNDLLLISHLLNKACLHFDVVRSVAEAMEFIEGHGVEGIRCIVVDYRLPDGTGLDFADWLEERKVDIPMFVHTSDESAAKKVFATHPSLTPITKGDVVGLADALGVDL